MKNNYCFMSAALYASDYLVRAALAARIAVLYSFTLFFAYVYPSRITGKLLEFRYCQFNCAVGRTACRKDGLKAAKRLIEINADPFVDGERTNAADRMAGFLFHIAVRQHGRFYVKRIFKLTVVNFHIACRYDEDRAVRRRKDMVLAIRASSQ